MLNSPSAEAPESAERNNSLTRGRFGSALFSSFCHSWFAASRKIRTDDPVGRLRDATC
jgi:hypothetical protein